MSNTLTSLLVTMGLISCMASGCGIGGKEISVNVNGTNIAIPLGDEGTYPPDFPLPKYPGSKVLSHADGLAQFMGKQGENGKVIMLTTKDSPDKVATYYKEQLQLGGWKPNAAGLEMSVGGVSLINATRGKESVMVQVMPASDSGGSDVQLMAHAI